MAAVLGETETSGYVNEALSAVGPVTCFILSSLHAWFPCSQVVSLHMGQVLAPCLRAKSTALPNTDVSVSWASQPYFFQG